MTDLPEMIDVQSSNVGKLGYDEKTQELFVMYKSNSEFVYIYKEVPASLNAKLMANDSKGGFLHQYFVKTKWEFRKERL